MNNKRSDGACNKPVSMPVTDAYRDNYDKIFKKEEKCQHKRTECVYESDDGEFERHVCKDCGVRFGVEIPQ